MLSMRGEKKEKREREAYTHAELGAGNRNEGEILAKFKHPQPFGFCKMAGRQRAWGRGEGGRNGLRK